MNITSIAPRQLTFPAAKSVATPAPVSEELPASTGDSFKASGLVGSTMTFLAAKKLVSVGIGAANGALSYGVLGKGSIGRTVAWSAGLNAAGNGLVGAGAGALIGSLPGVAASGAIAGGVLGATTGAVTGAVGGLLTGLCGSFVQSVTGLPPIASGAILGGLAGLFR